MTDLFPSMCGEPSPTHPELVCHLDKGHDGPHKAMLIWNTNRTPLVR